MLSGVFTTDPHPLLCHLPQEKVGLGLPPSRGSHPPSAVHPFLPGISISPHFPALASWATLPSVTLLGLYFVSTSPAPVLMAFFRPPCFHLCLCELSSRRQRLPGRKTFRRPPQPCILNFMESLLNCISVPGLPRPVTTNLVAGEAGVCSLPVWRPDFQSHRVGSALLLLKVLREGILPASPGFVPLAPWL